MNWSGAKAGRVLAALLRIGWSVKRHAVAVMGGLTLFYVARFLAASIIFI
jgi:hypothetical protein